MPSHGINRQDIVSNKWGVSMTRYQRKITSYKKRRVGQRPPRKTYGAEFRKKSSKGKFKKGTLVQYVYVNGRRVGTVKARRSR